MWRLLLSKIKLTRIKPGVGHRGRFRESIRGHDVRACNSRRGRNRDVEARFRFTRHEGGSGNGRYGNVITVASRQNGVGRDVIRHDE